MTESQGHQKYYWDYTVYSCDNRIFHQCVRGSICLDGREKGYLLKVLSNKKLGILVVKNKNNKTVGIITDGQIRRFNEKGNDLQSIYVKKVMTKNPLSINKDELAAKALSLMNNKKITSLCVHEKKKMKTIGVIHIHNILQTNIS